MDLQLTISGHCCDFALHPVDAAMAARIRALGEDIYKTDAIEWWRADADNTCGMKFDANALVDVCYNGRIMPFDTRRIANAAATLRRRSYFESNKDYLCVLGYDDEACSKTWTWYGVNIYDPAKFEFFVQRWDRIFGEPNYLVVDDIRYQGRFADDTNWGQSCGYSFREPMVIDLDAVRREMGISTANAA